MGEKVQSFEWLASIAAAVAMVGRENSFSLDLTCPNHGENLFRKA
jgi:hypothetical protein